MSHVSLPAIALIAALSISAQAQAQAVPPAETTVEGAVPAPASEEPDATTEEAEAAVSPAEAAFNARSAALAERVLAVDEEMKDAARLGALDPNVAKAALDQIQVGFQAEIDDFVQAFLNLAGEKSASMPETEGLALQTNAVRSADMLSILPQSMRDRAEAAARTPPPSEAPPSVE